MVVRTEESWIIRSREVTSKLGKWFLCGTSLSLTCGPSGVTVRKIRPISVSRQVGKRDYWWFVSSFYFDFHVMQSGDSIRQYFATHLDKTLYLDIHKNYVSKFTKITYILNGQITFSRSRRAASNARTYGVRSVWRWWRGEQFSIPPGSICCELKHEERINREIGSGITIRKMKAADSRFSRICKTRLTK